MSASYLRDGTSATMPFVLYKAAVAAVAGVSIPTLDKFRTRLNTAYNVGEAVWMIADEIALRAAAPKRHKTPRELAARVVRAS